MKSIFLCAVLVISASVSVVASQGGDTSGVSLQHFKYYYSKSSYHLPGKSWNDTRKIFEEKIQTIESDTIKSDLTNELLWKLMFSKYRFMNGEFKKFENDIVSIKDAIKKNNAQKVPINLVHIVEQVRDAERDYEGRVKNEQDPSFGDLYIKIRNEVIPEKSRVVVVNGDPVKIICKFPESGLDDLQKKRLEYLNSGWFMDGASDLGFFHNTRDLSSSFGELTEGYILSIPYLPILKREQEYIFILRDGERRTKRYRKSFHKGNFDREMLEISYMEGWYLDPAPAPNEIEIRLPTDGYTVYTTKGNREVTNRNDYEIGIRNALNQNLIDPMPGIRKAEDEQSYVVYYVPHQENLELNVFVKKKSVRPSFKIKNYLIWVAISIGVAAYHAQ